MAISNQHYIELYVNKQLVELESQRSLNLRINSLLFNPEQVSTKSADWSYSFDIPATDRNNRILDYANNLSKTNKFHSRYPAEVYTDGELLFNGSLTVTKYKNGKYSCNLVNIKIDTLEDIFGEDKMTDMKWLVDFDGAPTINSVNADMSTRYFFPFVSYGVFQKSPDSTGNYTKKHNIDKYNKWWVETFYPSLNVVETMKRCYESKGYIVGGTVFTDPNISEIYASTNLADDQSPNYNIGNPRFGKVSVSFHWDNNTSVSTNNNFTRSEGFRNSTGGLQQSLRFPYEMVMPAINASNSDAPKEYNFSAINLWSMLDSKGNSNVRVTVNDDTYMYDPGEHLIVIPATGWYKINLTASASLTNYNTSFNAYQWTTTYNQNDEFKQRQISVKRNWDRCPLEIQLIRNYTDNVELIKGPENVRFDTGDPNQEQYTYKGAGYTGATVDNKVEFISDFPHQYSVWRGTETNGLTLRDGQIMTNFSAVGGSGGSTGGSQRSRPAPDDYSISTLSGTIDQTGGGRGDTVRNSGGTGSNRSNLQNGNVFGYNTIPGSKPVMPYDQSVSEAFICGFTTMSGGKASVMRNGYSWAGNSSRLNNVFAKVEGLQLRAYENGTTAVTGTDYCKNEYANADAYCSASNGNMIGAYMQCCVWLEKNDILELVAVQRDYDGQKYGCSVDGTIIITAMSERDEELLRSDQNWNWNSQTEFPTKLNLFNFTNKETKVSDWIGNVQKAFNLEILQDGDNIDINVNKGINKSVQYAVKLDDRVNSDEIESEYISYPRDMSVKYKTDVDEYGFWLTVPQTYVNNENWAEYGDSGYTVIKLSDDSYNVKSQNTQTEFSYTYYDTFNWKEVLQDGSENGTERNISIPVIEKYEYMAEGYDYAESMRHDGYSLHQRFWYRKQPSTEYVWLSSHMPEKVTLAYTENTNGGINLSYKDIERSILTEYFNIHPMLASNYINVDCYLSPLEYRQIKSGALINIDKDLYFTSEISGYDPTGNNETSLKLIKKI